MWKVAVEGAGVFRDSSSKQPYIKYIHYKYIVNAYIHGGPNYSGFGHLSRYHGHLMHDFRHATCNEAFKDYDFRDACSVIRSIGYTGIEIAPFTLADDPLDISPEQRNEYKQNHVR